MTGSQTVILSNPTKKVLNIFGIVATGDFIVQGGVPCGFTIGPGGECPITVLFLPQSVGVQSGVLSVNDDANDTPQKVKLTGTGIPPTLASISVMPNPATVPAGLSQQFTATGFYTNYPSGDITGTVTWSAAPSGMVSVSSTGLAVALAQGTATITASSTGISGSATVNVGPAVVESVSVSPLSATVKRSATVQLAATGSKSDGSSADLTATAPWTSLAPSIVSVNATGLVSGVSPGTASVQATYANLSAKATITVPTPVAVSDALLPPKLFIPLGVNQSYRCQVTYDDGSTASFSGSSLLWSSSSPAICSINTNGIASCNSLGTVAISANLCPQTTPRLDASVNQARNNMSSPRMNHAAAPLPDGRALVAGGSSIQDGAPVATADLFDPSLRTFSPTGSMSVPRSNHTATLLATGKVLIAGGRSSSGTVSTAELYDPLTGTFTPTGSMNFARQGHTATLLTNGTVLVVGGGVLATELYDPATGSFTQVGSMSVGFQASATLLTSGKVLFTGGGYPVVSSAEIFDPVTGAFSPTGSMNSAREGHTAVLLGDGTVFIAGGNNGSGALASTEIYNPATGTFAPSGSLATARDTHTAVLLSTGKVLLSGGENSQGYLTSGELFDPGAGASFMPGVLDSGHYAPGVGHTASLLSNGQVLITGGYTGYSPTTLLDQAQFSGELFVPLP